MGQAVRSDLARQAVCNPFFWHVNDAEDNSHGLVPTDLDLNRLEAVEASGEGRVEAESGDWIAIRYPVSPEKAKSWKWCAWSLLVNCPGLPARSAPYELKNLKALLTFMAQLETERKP